MPSRGMGGARWIQKREPFPHGHENGQKKSTVATMGGFCGMGIKKYPS